MNEQIAKYKAGDCVRVKDVQSVRDDFKDDLAKISEVKDDASGVGYWVTNSNLSTTYVRQCDLEGEA
ncbi:hypothetical protein HB852_09965 [Listeria grandensis]|uniref:hypothetical protein n=1 Tax=Listeria grandensis TaxID=1494963 RepID=UPI00162AF59C|nr:hypothetical protein [Listeria grandensis]MBC1474943.1 hypothetical protein [Listeria grandensis]